MGRFDERDRLSEVNVRAHLRRVGTKSVQVRQHQRRDRAIRRDLRRAKRAASREVKAVRKAAEREEKFKAYVTKNRATVAERAKDWRDPELIEQFESYMLRQEPASIDIEKEIKDRIAQRGKGSRLQLAYERSLRYNGPSPSEGYMGRTEEREELDRLQRRQNYKASLPEITNSEVLIYLGDAVAMEDEELTKLALREVKKRAEKFDDELKRENYLLAADELGDKAGKNFNLTPYEARQRYAAFLSAMAYLDPERSERSPRERRQAMEVFGEEVWDDAYHRARRARQHRYAHLPEGVGLYLAVSRDERDALSRYRYGR